MFGKAPTILSLRRLANNMTLRVFLVEDSAVIRSNLVAALEELAPVDVIGFAEDENTAISWVRTHPQGCDLLVIDIFLKQGSGLTVLREAAHFRYGKVVLSNYATPDVRRTCLKLGADRVFDKSNEIEALVEFCARFDAGDTGPAGL